MAVMVGGRQRRCGGLAARPKGCGTATAGTRTAPFPGQATYDVVPCSSSPCCPAPGPRTSAPHAVPQVKVVSVVLEQEVRPVVICVHGGPVFVRVHRKRLHAGRQQALLELYDNNRNQQHVSRSRTTNTPAFMLTDSKPPLNCTGAHGRERALVYYQHGLDARAQYAVLAVAQQRHVGLAKAYPKSPSLLVSVSVASVRHRSASTPTCV